MGPKDVTKRTWRERARKLRKESTFAEKTLWYYLKGKALGGYRFHRQYVMGSYIVDFVCWEKKLIIEIDGGQHMQNSEYDESRTIYLNSRGFQVLRFWNNEVLDKTESVVESILETLNTIDSL